DSGRGDGTELAEGDESADDGLAAGGGTGPGGTTRTTTRRTATTAARASTKPIIIGIHDDNTAAAAQAYGVNGLPGTQMPYVQEIVDWINKNGGMGGRRLEVVAHVTENLNGSFDQQAQEACVDFTEDHKVLAVVG